jgi:hypothetical protein
MNKLIASLLLLILTSCVKAQEKFQEIDHFKQFEVLLEGGWARPAGSGAKTGVLLALEPRFNIIDKFTIGLRFESTAMARAGYQINNLSADGEAGLGLALLATGDYYFNNRTVRPFFGMGIGVYNFVSVEASSSGGGSITVPSVTKPGGMLRTGVEFFHHARVSVHYNIVGKTNTINNNYMGISLGIVLGGGTKEEYR